MASVVENLRAARALIEKPEHFVRKTYATKDDVGFREPCRVPCDPLDPDATCFCSLGAVRRVLGKQDDYGSIESSWLRTAARELFPLKAQFHHLTASLAIIPDVNDNGGHSAALRMFDKAIELALREAELHP